MSDTHLPDEPTRSPETPEPAPPQGPKLPWPLLLGVLAGALFMVLALFFTARNTRRQHVSQVETHMATPLIPRETPEPVVNATPAEYSHKLFVPNDNGELVARQVEGEMILPADPQEARAVQARATVQELMQAAPEDFPAGTQLHGAKAEGETIQLDFNDKFTQRDFWQGSARTMATIYAIVNSVTASVDGAQNVQFLVDGHPIELLGEMDASEPFEPKDEMVASP